jgi:hypothetical protein
MKQGRVSALSGEYLDVIGRRLKELYVETGAASVIMVDTMGQIISQVGAAGELDITTVVSLLAASFATTSEMSRRLRERRRTFNLTFHEGERFDIYASNIASGLFLVLIFDRETYAPKIGMVWLFIKRSIQDLLRVVAETETAKPKETLTSDFAKSLRDELDSVFQEKKTFPDRGRKLEEAQETPPPVKTRKLDDEQMKELFRRMRKRQQDSKKGRT